MNGKVMLKMSELQEATGLSRSTAYMLVASGEIQSIKIGRAIRIPVAAVENFINRKLEEAHAE
jgi:excisionase family DNA binding protein